MSQHPEPREHRISLRRLLDLAWPGHPRRWADVPQRVAPSLFEIGRLTLATIIAYILSVQITGTKSDLTGALTALLVVQATSLSSLRQGLLRVSAVLTGVLVALGVSTWVGLTWWSLAVVVGVALLLAKVLHLGDQSLETAISAMLILGVRRPDTAAEARFIATVIGSLVGMVFGLVFAPRYPHRKAASELRRASGQLAGLLRRAADSMAMFPVTYSAVETWLSEARGVDAQIGRAAQTVGDLKEARRLNPHALTTTNAEPMLRVQLTILERVQLAIQALFATILREAPIDPTVHDGFGDEIRPAFAVVLETMADAITAFAEDVDAEVEGRAADRATTLDGNLDELRETRAIVTELMLVQAYADQSRWLLRGSILAAVEQVLSQLDIRERERLRTTYGLPPLEG